MFIISGRAYCERCFQARKESAERRGGSFWGYKSSLKFTKPCKCASGAACIQIVFALGDGSI